MSVFSWRKEITSTQWRTLLAGHLGWLLDGFDAMLYSFALLDIKSEFSLNGTQAGALASVALVTAAIGGIGAGFLCDRIGRVRVLIFSILGYSIFTGLTATSQSLEMLIVWRGLVGVGLGAEWTAGSVLIAESWPDRRRATAIGLMQSGWAIGYIAAALISAWILPAYGWRVMFLLGTLPALATLWIRRNIPEPEIWRNQAPKSPRTQFQSLLTSRHLGRILVASSVATFLLFSYWGLFTWIPAYLAAPSAQGGVGLSVLKSSWWIIPMELGAFFGYISFGFLADRFGRRLVFLIFVISAALIIPIYGGAGRHEFLILALGPFLGFFGHGYFSLFGSMLAEIFPTEIRATAQGFCYNSGKALSAFAPMTIGFLADRFGIGAALGATSLFLLMAAGLIFLLPETQGMELE